MNPEENRRTVPWLVSGSVGLFVPLFVFFFAANVEPVQARAEQKFVAVLVWPN